LRSANTLTYFATASEIRTWKKLRGPGSLIFTGDAKIDKSDKQSQFFSADFSSKKNIEFYMHSIRQPALPPSSWRNLKFYLRKFEGNALTIKQQP
jgi:hypothetical protein